MVLFQVGFYPPAIKRRQIESDKGAVHTLSIDLFVLSVTFFIGLRGKHVIDYVEENVKRTNLRLAAARQKAHDLRRELVGR